MFQIKECYDARVRHRWHSRRGAGLVGEDPSEGSVDRRRSGCHYVQLNNRSDRIANTLIAAGIRPGSHVGFLGKNSAAFFEIWVGANKAGCALAPLNWRSAPPEIAEVVHDANVSLIFAGRDFTELAERVRQIANIALEVVGADLKIHAPEWQTVGPMVGRERLEDGLCGITRGPLSRIAKPIVAAINGWCVGHGVELAMACDIRIASERAQFGTFEVRRGMHPADGGIVRLVNTCGCRGGVGVAAHR
jgi:hypothetical protein